MSHQRNSQMQEAIARALRFRERLPNTEAAGIAAMDTAASIMDLVAAAGLTLGRASSLQSEPPPRSMMEQEREGMSAMGNG